MTEQKERAIRKRRLWRKYARIVACGGYLVAIALVAVLAPWLAPHSSEAMSAETRLLPPDATFWLGTDEFGRDIASRIMYGARLSLGISVAAVIVSTLLGTLVGMTAGYFRRWVEHVFMRLMDTMLCFPPIILAILIMYLLGSNVTNLILTISLLYVPHFARITYSATLQVREQEYIEAARATGAPTARVLRRAVLPNILAPVFVQFSLAMGYAILIESGLSFLGLGPPPPTPSWGRMIEQSFRFMHLSPHIIIWPAAAISLTVLSLNILGDALRDSFDPRLRN